ncbi:MAG: GTP cyclohydrolase FolE2 [Holophagales bacterium]|nr:GTP cyclohydrolase FolE2 [Holophagales bacterium]
MTDSLLLGPSPALVESGLAEADREKITGLADIQNSQDQRNIAIDKVGVKDILYPIVVDDRSNGPQHTVGRVNMYVDLPHHFKGTHMSRFLEVLNQYRGAISVEKIPELLDSMRQRLDAETAHFEVTFTYFVKKAAPVTGAEGLMGFECTFEAARGKEDDFVLSVEVPVTTLCPCSKEISEYGAHNQRGNVSVKVRFDDLVWIEDIIEVVEASASCSLFPILKRPDEKWVTERAYDNPRFVEDMVREVTLRLQKDPRIQWFQVQVENFESIHAHNAYAYIEKDKSV